MRLSTTAFSKPWAPCCLARKISAVPPSATFRRMVYRDCRLIRAGSPAPQNTTRAPSPVRVPPLARGAGLRAAPVVTGLVVAAPLASPHGDRKAVLRGRQGAGRVRRERARRRVGPVEVDDERPV